MSKSDKKQKLSFDVQFPRFSTCLFYPPPPPPNFSRDMNMSQEKSKTMPMQILGGVKEVYYGIVQVETVEMILNFLFFSELFKGTQGFCFKSLLC